MASYKISHVAEQTRPWESTKGGPMLSYRVSLKDGNGDEHANVEWARKASSAPPTVGQTIEGDIDTSGQYGPKFRATPSAGFSGGGSRARDPKEVAAIQRMHDQEMALRAVDIAARLELVKPESSAALFSLIASTTDWFGRDTKKSKDAA